MKYENHPRVAGVACVADLADDGGVPSVDYVAGVNVVVNVAGIAVFFWCIWCS